MRTLMITPDHSPVYVNVISDEEIAAAVARLTDACLRDDYRLLCLYRDDAYDRGDSVEVEARDRQVFFTLAEAQGRGLDLLPRPEAAHPQPAPLAMAMAH